MKLILSLHVTRRKENGGKASNEGRLIGNLGGGGGLTRQVSHQQMPADLIGQIDAGDVIPIGPCCSADAAAAAGASSHRLTNRATEEYCCWHAGCMHRCFVGN